MKLIPSLVTAYYIPSPSSSLILFICFLTSQIPQQEVITQHTSRSADSNQSEKLQMITIYSKKDPTEEER